MHFSQRAVPWLLADVPVPLGFQACRADPGQRISGQLAALLVAQVHEQPVAEDHVIGALLQLQLGRIAHLEAHIAPACMHAADQAWGLVAGLLQLGPKQGRACARWPSCSPQSGGP